MTTDNISDQGADQGSTQLLGTVRQTTTIEAGLSTMRSGIAQQLVGALGPQLMRQARDPEAYNKPGGGGTEAGGGSSGGSGINLAALNQLYMGLTTDDAEWSEALLANTPQAEAAGQEAGVTASKSAFA